MVRKQRTSRKPVEYAITIVVLLVINFALPRMMPGDAFLVVSGEAEDPFMPFTAAQRAFYLEQYGLDRPLPEQFARYIQNLMRGDLGQSYHYRQPVRQMIWRRMPWTALLVVGATIVSVVIGVSLASLSVWGRRRWVDWLIYLVLMVVGEIPAFLIGLVLLIVFAVTWEVLPLSGSLTPFLVYESWWAYAADIARHAVLPMTALALTQVGGVYLLVRNSLTTVLTRDYMVTAVAKGLRQRRIRYGHALRNALLPLVTRVAMQMGGMIGGAILAENVFAYPGLGLMMREAVYMRDFPLLQGTFLVISIGILSGNALADSMYRRLDPRVRGGRP